MTPGGLTAPPRARSVPDVASELAPGTDVASRAQAGSMLGRNDYLRIRELDRRMIAGQSEEDAWAAIVTDKRIGFKRHRGADRVDVQVAARLLSAFYARVAPAELAVSRGRIARRAAAFAPKAWDRVEKIVMDEDPQVALSASKYALQAIGMGEKSAGATATFNGPANVVFTFASGQKARANGSA